MAVIREHGKVRWNRVDLPMLNHEFLSTGCSYALSRHQACPWMRHLPFVKGAWLTYNGAQTFDSTSALSTGLAQASVIVEREHQTGPRLRYDRFLYTRVADGRVFQAGPDKDVEFGHHPEQRPDWLDALYHRSTSTGW